MTPREQAVQLVDEILFHCDPDQAVQKVVMLLTQVRRETWEEAKAAMTKLVREAYPL